MELSVGDLHMLYYLAFIGSAKSNEEGAKDAEAKAAEALEDAMRGEV